ncbi:hypothetical protein LPJGGPFB_03153 [Ensifer adhaerens]|uniref:Arc family DNA-binding protein n=1 Tax=Ensifer adhaerens TaxID=106592 RepID=UPI001569EE79|nr:Arc family DNA-binding protein [Ensifer adhaerens]NRP19895.1 hypothetical protein [Ensifer adhaerens]
MADRSSYPSEQADKYLLRLPDGMRERLKDSARENNRSMNAEIVARLEASFLSYKREDGVVEVGMSRSQADELMKRLDRLNERLGLDPLPEAND